MTRPPGNASILSKLYHHDELNRFKLFRIGEGLYYYEIIEAPVTPAESVQRP